MILVMYVYKEANLNRYFFREAKVTIMYLIRKHALLLQDNRILLQIV